MPANIGLQFLADFKSFSQQTQSEDQPIPYHSSMDCMDDQTHVGTSHVGSKFFRADIIGASCSCAFLLFVGLIILTDKRVRGHPNNIIAFICMADSWTYFQYITRFLICGYDLNYYANWLFATTVQYPIYFVLIEKCGLNWLDQPWVDMKENYL